MCMWNTICSPILPEYPNIEAPGLKSSILHNNKLSCVELLKLTHQEFAFDASPSLCYVLEIALSLSPIH